MNIGDKLRNYRNHIKCSQEEIAFKSNINSKYYGRIERNESCPTIDILERICNALGIDIMEIFLFDIDQNVNKACLNSRVCDIITTGIKNGITIHFNRNILYDKCERTIWYNGYIGSISFDEFELQLYAVGNIKGRLFLDFDLIYEFSSEDISSQIRKYINNDEDLKNLIEMMDYDDKILKEKNGNVLFIDESNWLSARIINNMTKEEMYSDIILDTDNIVQALGNTNLLLDYIFSKE